MFARYVHGGVENRYAASITTNAESPETTSQRASAIACCRRFEAATIRDAQNEIRMSGSSVPENLHAIAAPVASPTATGDELFQNRYRARVMNTPTGTSVVTS